MESQLTSSAPTATRVKGIRLKGSTFKGGVVEDDVALESPVNMYINNEHFLTIFATPYQLRELAIGHLLGEGIIDSVSEVSDLTLDGTDVLLTINKPDLQRRLEDLKHIKMIISSCGSIDDYLKILDKINKPRVHSDFAIDAKELTKLLRDLAKESGSFKMSIAVHSAALAIDGSVRYQVEDVSRHASVDKIIGIAALQEARFSQSVLLTTGRQASDMVLKAARVGIPITVSLRGPIFSGVYSAQKTGVTLASVTRGKGLTIYTHPDRVKISR